MNEPKRLTRRDALKTVAAIAALPLFPAPSPGATLGPRKDDGPATRDRRFDGGWRFFRGDAPGAEAPAFDDSAWRALDLPHDWSIEDLPERAETTGESAIWTTGASIPARVGPFDAAASEGQTATGFVVGGTGWYRKRFSTSDIPDGALVELRFDGVYMDSDVWLNGEHLGSHPYGYTGFAFDATPHLKRSGENVVAVRVRNAGKNSRWYSGSGIYRHVWLTVTGAVRIPTWGVAVTATEISPKSAKVMVTTTIENRGTAPAVNLLEVDLFGPDGRSVAALVGEKLPEIAPGASYEHTQTFDVDAPKLWSPDSPTLYRAEVLLRVTASEGVNRVVQPFGIRSIEVDAERGLRINGEPIKLKGGCLHHDNGALGAAAIGRAEERRVELMKANGYNAIRTSHNPPSPAFLDACDRLGVVVIDEAFDMWRAPKNPQDYSRFFDEWSERDVQSMVRRDRNHPSVVFWSIGNEIHERAEPEGVEIAARLVAAIKRLDASRPVTAAICHFWDYKDRPWEQTDPAFEHLDVGGYNYKLDKYESDHARVPKRVMMGTESFPFQAFENWQAVEKNAYVLGDFVWTGMDYLGETGIGSSYLDRDIQYGLQPYPWFNAYCGDVDLIGGKKPQSYFRDVVWRRSPVEMAVQRPVPDGHKETISAWGWSDELRSWTWPGSEGKPLRVRVFTRGDAVRLLLNGKEVGTAQVSEATKLTAELMVPYAPGELRAVATSGGKEIGSVVFETAGAPAGLRLAVDRAEIRADRDDLSFVTVEVVDAKGRLVPDASVHVRFALDGAAELAAVGTADPRDAASFHRPRRKTFHGRCLAIVRPTGKTGEATLTAEADGLTAATARIDIRNRAR